MAKFTVNVGRTLSSLISGNYKTHEALYEFVDNSITAEATEVYIKVLDGDKRPCNTLIISDNGNAMSAKELEDSLVLACDRERSDYEISEFGVGYKAGAFSLGNRVWIITKQDGKISGAFLDRERINKDEEYDGPTEIDPNKAQQLWKKYAQYPQKSGTIFVITDLIQTEYSSCETFVKGMHHYNRLACRYRNFIDSGRLQIFTVNGKKGAPKLIQSFDPLRRFDSDVEVLCKGSVLHKKSSVTMKHTLTKVPHGSKSTDFGIRVVVAGVDVFKDNDTLLGMYKSGSSHSWIWHLRGEVEFATKKDFHEFFNFTSNKHGILAKDSAFGDWVRDTEMGKHICREGGIRKTQLAEERIVKTLEDKVAANAAFAEKLNTGHLLYGPDKALKDTYFGNVTQFQAGIFDDNIILSRWNEDNGILEYNESNPKIHSLMSSGSSAKQDTARVIAAFYAVHSENNNALMFLLNALAD
jgi:hypothetical protein